MRAGGLRLRHRVCAAHARAGHRCWVPSIWRRCAHDCSSSPSLKCIYACHRNTGVIETKTPGQAQGSSRSRDAYPLTSSEQQSSGRSAPPGTQHGPRPEPGVHAGPAGALWRAAARQRPPQLLRGRRGVLCRRAAGVLICNGACPGPGTRRSSCLAYVPLSLPAGRSALAWGVLPMCHGSIHKPVGSWCTRTSWRPHARRTRPTRPPVRF